MSTVFASAVSARRLALGTAVAAAFAATLLTPSVASAADAPRGGAADCVASTTIPSRLGGMTVELTNSLTAGPKAVLKDEGGKAVATVDRAHPEDLSVGMKIKNAASLSPVFLDRSQGGPTPWRETPFPALPHACVTIGEGADKEAGPVVVTGKCSVSQVVPSVFDRMTVQLTNSLTAGPKAVLKDEEGKAVATVDRAHPEDLSNGMKIKNAETAGPVFLDRSQGPAPWHETAFPKLPKGCTTGNTGTGTGTGTGAGTGTGTGTTTTSTTSTNSATTTTATQTKVVPAGGVAAGAEVDGGQDTAMLAGGAALALAGALGLGHVVRRRRAGV
ncbi:hypothetical protein [Streptomyces sp. NPDC058157]|uniref:hypothetical protein n=1 Tax=Streptomyces sp. NPDC058157 TaxID=3346360 RepID=UPI0036E4493C